MAASADGGVLYRGLLLNFDSKDNTDSEAVSVGAAPCGCPKRVNSFCYFKIKQVKGISAWATTRGRPYEIIFMRLNDNLTVCSLLDHPGKPIPEPYPGSGVAMRQTIIWRYSSGRAMRAPTVTYIRTDIIIYRLPDTGKPFLRTTAFRHRSVNPQP